MQREPSTPIDAAELRRQAEDRWRQQHSEAGQTEDPNRLVHELQVHQIELEMQNAELQTERHALKAGLEKYSELYDFAPVGYLTLDREGTIREANLTSASLLGIERSRLVNGRFGLYVSETSLPVFNGFLAKVFESKIREICEVALVREGELLMDARIEAAVTASGLECHAAIEDVTERNATEQALRRSELKYRKLHESMMDAFASVDMTGSIREFNRAFQEMLGYDSEELKGLTYLDLTPEKWHRAEARIVEEQILPRGFSEVYEKEYRGKGGVIFPVELRTFLVRDEHGRPAGMWSIVRDITARRRLEERLRQSQKMEGIGHLAGGMAHEFNNILAAMMLSLSLVQLMTEKAEARDLLHEVEGLSRRAADLIKQLLAFSRQSVMQRQPLDLAAVVSGQGKMLERLLGERVALKFTKADRLPWVNADQTLMEQVVLNLCLNARDAMKDGGHLGLHMEEAEVGAEQAAAHEGARPGNYVRLSVSDTGCGMDERTMERLFEPFFTTKDVGQGTGLGLATVRGIVEQHHGWVEVESTLGKGSTFRVYLPNVQPPAAGAPVSQEAVSSEFPLRFQTNSIPKRRSAS